MDRRRLRFRGQSGNLLRGSVHRSARFCSRSATSPAQIGNTAIRFADCGAVTAVDIATNLLAHSHPHPQSAWLSGFRSPSRRPDPLVRGPVGRSPKLRAVLPCRRAVESHPRASIPGTAPRSTFPPKTKVMRSDQNPWIKPYFPGALEVRQANASSMRQNWIPSIRSLIGVFVCCRWWIGPGVNLCAPPAASRRRQRRL
jgi:hypothetical protein